MTRARESHDPAAPADSPPAGVERRTLLRGLASGLAGAVAASTVPSAATAAPPPVAATESVQPSASAATSGPGLLDAHHRHLLEILADAIVPGSVAAGVVGLVDRVAAVDTPGRQRALMNAIGAFEQVARRDHQRPWVELDEPVRLAILQEAATGPTDRVPPAPWTRGQRIAVGPPPAPPPATFRDHFEYLRTLVTTAYVATEPGMRELGWTGRTGWPALPTCDHADADHE
jgi:hypothetical protein